MKELRARGIQTLTKALRGDCVQLMRLSRDDVVLQGDYRGALHFLEAAETRAALLVQGFEDYEKERIDA